MDKVASFYRTDEARGEAHSTPTGAVLEGRGPRDADIPGYTPPKLGLADAILWLGLLALIVPTMVFVARESWSGEQGAHGPIVLMTGLWLLWRKWPATRHLVARPAAWKATILVVPLLAAYALARITQIIELEGYIMYAAVIAAAYGIFGGAVLRKLAFPLIYLAFMFPPPETVVYTFTLPLKIWISESAIALLQLFGYPIGGTGVTIQIGQYQLLVAAACSGLNSIVSLSALTTFYIYIRHSDDVRYALILLLCVVPVAVAANFVRVLILILLTYHAGEATAQSFVHDLAGLTMFGLALLFIFLIDFVLARFLTRRRPSPARAETTGD